MNENIDKEKNEEKGETPAKKKKKLKKGRRRALVLQIQIVSLFLVLCFLLGAFLPLRQTFSEEEKRELTKFPTPTFETLMDGSFFSQLELWYADTYPFRQTWINVNSTFSSLFGKNDQQVVGTLPSGGEEIPTVKTDDLDWLNPPIPSGGQTTTKKPESSDQTPVTTDKPTTDAPTTDVPTTSSPSITLPSTSPDTGGTSTGDPDNLEKIGAAYLDGDTAYEIYGFSKKQSDRYIALVNALANKMEGKATVYPIVAPLSYGINLDSATQQKYGMSDQSQALIYMYSGMNDLVKKVYTYNNLLAHKDEYLYFRTDHHWTSLGAYYAYEMFCAHKGISPIPLSSYTEMKFDGFLGTMYSSCNNPTAMKSNPDTVYAYVPNGTNVMNFWESKKSDPTKWNVVTNVSKWASSSKYSTFIGGDNPYSEIHNSSKSDGSSCVVVKNSFGNAFVPFLVDHYEYVYVVDLRYYDKWSASYNGGKTFTQLVEEKGITDILIVTNIIATGSSGMLTSMENLFTK